MVSGLVTPDNYLVDKVTLSVIKSTKGSKEMQCVYNEGGSDIDDGPGRRGGPQPVLRHQRGTEGDSAGSAKAIDKYYGKPYDIEFGIDADLPFPDNVIILQVRPGVGVVQEGSGRRRRRRRRTPWTASSASCDRR